MIDKKPIPPLTCPHIDSVSELVAAVVKLAKDEDISKVMLEKYLDVINAELELIRQSNDELRIASAHWYKKAKLFAKMREKLQGK